MLPVAILFGSSYIAADAATGVQSFSGGGEKDVLSFAPITSPVIATATCTGDYFFKLDLEYASGFQDTFGNRDDNQGNWIGTFFPDAGKNYPIEKMSLEGYLNWTLKIAPLASTPLVSTKNFKGSGYRVVKFAKRISGVKTVLINHYSTSIFMVHSIGKMVLKVMH